MRIDACVDVKVPGIDYSRSFSAYVELDPCRYVIRAAFEKWSQTVILFEYDWGMYTVCVLSHTVIYITFLVNSNSNKNSMMVIIMNISINTHMCIVAAEG